MATTESSIPILADLAPPARAEACAACGAPVEAWDRFCPSCGTERPARAAAVAPREEERFSVLPSSAATQGVAGGVPPARPRSAIHPRALASPTARF